ADFDDVGDQAALSPGDAEARGKLIGHVLDDDAEPASHDATTRDELPHHVARHVGGNREADPLPRGDDGGIDAHDFAVEVQQRPTRVARIDGGVGLDEIFVGGHADPGPRGGGDDAGGHRAIETEGVSDRDHPLADAQAVGVAELGYRQRSGGIDLEHGEVGLYVAADEPSGELASVRESHDDRLGIFYDVVV